MNIITLAVVFVLAASPHRGHAGADGVVLIGPGGVVVITGGGGGSGLGGGRGGDGGGVLITGVESKGVFVAGGRGGGGAGTSVPTFIPKGWRLATPAETAKIRGY